ncbi:MAG TPA: pyruvate formate-lyase-activating protein [Vicinamibacterales bacterium]|jgi:pyruvate formate lyase activating enzyme|nr:pyruvate formate-lyase-activating protein [Vicinamibacterales bacterium]
MADAQSAAATPLEAKSPYELRVNLGKDVPESDVRTALATGNMGFLHSFTTGSAVDGPGIRVVAWTAGCQFRCLYCHNPDTWTMTNGIPVTIARATEVLGKYRHGLKTMSGGFTLSGGEPLMQDRFAVKLFSAAKKMGVHTALDTNGHLGDRLTDAELETIDLVMLDIKAWDPELHRRLVGMDIEPTLAFARRLAARKRPVWLRYVLVPGWTDDVQDISKLAAFVGSLGNVERVDVLPFHQMGRFKWKRLNLNYELDAVQPPSPEVVERTCALFREQGLKAY